MSMWATAQDTIVIGNKAKQDMSLQKNSTKPINSGTVLIGDTVVINKACVRYLTGEKPSEWVYNVRHVIGQIGSERFPEGIYLENIRSWVAIEPLMTAPPVTPTSEVEPTEVENESKSESESEPSVGANPTEPVVPAEPTDSAQSAVPAEPTDSAQSTEPVEPIEVDTIANNSVATEELANDSIRVMDRFTIGVRGGASSMLQKLANESAKSQFGFDVLLDLQYAHYWQTKKEHKLGLLTGLTVGFAQGGVSAPNSKDEYEVTDPDGWDVQYTITADNIKETDRQIQVEVPLMFSLVSRQGVFFNFGPRFFLPVYTPYKTTMENPNVEAYFEKTDVYVTNEVITGRIEDKQVTGKGKTNNSLKLNITLGAELGYEWQLKNGHSLGLGAYANYGLYSMFKQDANDKKNLVTVTPTTIPFTITTGSATEAWTQKMGFVDVGVKLAYHFNWWKTKPKNKK